MTTATKRTITETDIIAARERVAAAEAKGEQQDWNDALLASPDLTPEMVKDYFNAGETEVAVKVHWCACPGVHGTPARIVCETCGLPPFWVSRDSEGEIIANVTLS